MNDARWQRLNQIFHAALAVPPAEREIYIAGESAGDFELQAEIKELLLSHESEDEFLSRNIFIEPLEAPSQEIEPGAQIGSYKIIREIGRGGMGAVFLAERQTPDFTQQVALKIIKRGMDSDEIVRRFRQERQILASLNHPNIARLLDGGTTADGRPFLAMEFVAGVSIDRFCAERNLSEKEILRIFQDVCAAVSYAHQNLVVHRDLKPSNVLVTEDGKIKLLDFGIAKILGESGENQTAAATRIFTPEYASPEQKRGERATTATDVFSLGVILSELLQTQSLKLNAPSRLSFKFQVPSWFSLKSSPNGEQNQIASIQIPRSADLAKIILMATHEDAGRRYHSVNELAEDVRRYALGLPVAAQKDSFSYRARKFAGRHRAGVAAAAVVALSLASGFSVAVWQANVARRERAKAERRFEDVRKIANSFLFEFQDSIRNTPGTENAQRLLVNKALEYLNKLAEESESDDASLLRELSTAYVRVGEAQADSLKEPEAALFSYRRAEEFDRRALQLTPQNFAARKALTQDLFKQTEVLTGTRRFAEALPLYQEIIRLHRELSEREPAELRHLTDLAQDFERISAAYRELDRSEEAEENLRAALETIEKRIAAAESQTPPMPEAKDKIELSFAYLERGDLLRTLNNWSAAADSFRFAGKIVAAVWAADETQIQAFRNLCAAHNRTGDALAELGDFPGALAEIGVSLDLIKRRVRQNPNDNQMRLAECYYTLKVAGLLEKVGAAEKALATLRAGLNLRAKLTAEEKAEGMKLLYHAGIFEQGGDLLVKLKQTAEARRAFQESLAAIENILKSNADDLNLKESAARLREKLARL